MVLGGVLDLGGLGAVFRELHSLVAASIGVCWVLHVVLR